MRSLLVSLALVACGPSPRGKVAAVAKPAAPLPPPAATTCADAGVLLRGPVENELDNRDAGPTRAAAIEEACGEGKWSAEILHCVADSPDPQPCLDKLSDAQHELYDQKLIAWSERFPSEVGGDEGGDGYVDCEDGVGDVAMYAPPIALAGADADFAVGMRRRAVVRLCNQQSWDSAVKQCLANAKDAPGMQACEAQLPPDQLTALAGRLGQLDALVAATFKKRKQPASCAGVVAQHYADAAWKGKVDTLVPAERKKVIAESRSRMAKACTMDAWDPTVRSCLVAGGAEQCFVATSFLWTFPATGVLATSTGVAECDAYIEAMNKTQTCAKLAKESRDAFKESFTAMRGAFDQMKTMDETGRKQMADACRYGAEALLQVLSSSGC